MGIQLTRNTIETFFHGSRVASHPHKQGAQREPIMIPEHMPAEHKKYLTYHANEFRLWSKGIGENTQAVMEHFLSSDSEPEQGYKFCASLTKLADRYGHNRLEKACQRTLAYSTQPAIRNTHTILKNEHDKLTEPNEISNQEIQEMSRITHGAAYYKRRGAHHAE